MLTGGQISMMVLSLIGLILNLTVGIVVSLGLKLVNSDLTMIFIISVTDIVFYLWNILRIILSEASFIIIDYDPLELRNDVWCPIDLTLSMTLIGASIELVAVLSIMRYLKVCHQKEFKDWIWYFISGISILLASSISLGNYHYHTYRWSRTNMFCLTVINETGVGLDNRPYYLFFYFTYVIRSMLSLITIVFCYFKVTYVYREAVKPTTTINIPASSVFKLNEFPGEHTKLNDDSTQNQKLILNRFSDTDKQYKVQRTFTTIKLIVFTLSYIICLLPDVIFAILNLAYDISPTPLGAVVSNSLLCCSGIVSALFVLFTNTHAQQYLNRTIKDMIPR
ncbi:family A G protein-coupled receptor-like protein [Neoconidiobolus thromboides FSU 785]|nr:family A G protein-coupled receptor-like protein [Neoconidiobolus thromboides FSU 785]